MRTGLIVGGMCAAAGLWAGAGELPVQRLALDNGLTVVVVPRPGAPLVHAQVALRAGSAGDPEGAAGSAALLAKLLAQAPPSAKFAPKAKALAAREASLLEALALEQARQAQRDQEARLRGLPVPAPGPRIAALQADLARLLQDWEEALRRESPPLPAPEALAFPAAVAASADGLVAASRFLKPQLAAWCGAEVRRWTAPPPALLTALRAGMDGGRASREADPLVRLADATAAVALPGRPLPRPQAEVLRWSDLDRFRSLWVHPSRLAVILVGDLTLAEAGPAVKAAFGAWRTPAAALRPPPEDPPQAGERRVILEADAPAPAFQVAWRIPGTGHPDQPALEMLGAILSAGATSRLSRDLLDATPIAAAVRVTCGTGDGGPPGLFTIAVQARGETSAGELGSAIVRAIDQIRGQAPSPEELARALALARAEEAGVLDDPARLAEALARAWVEGGDPAVFTHRLARLAQVTGAGVQDAARKHLTEANRTVAALRRPKDLAQAAEAKQVEETLERKLRELIGRQYTDPAKVDEAVKTQLSLIRQLPLPRKLQLLEELDKRLAAPAAEVKK